MTPAPPRQIAAAVESLLDQSWAPYAKGEAYRVLEDLLEDGDVLRDDLGRVYPPNVPDLFEAAAALARASDTADALAEFEVDARALTTSSEAFVSPDILRHPLLSPEEVQGLASRIEAGDRDALRALVRRNARLVWSVVLPARARRSPGLDVEDMFQEGMIGVIRAGEKFDYRKGYRFSTYATWWIRQATSRAIADKGRTIRLPVHQVEFARRVRRVRRSMERASGEEVTASELATRLDVDTDKVEAIEVLMEDVKSIDTDEDVAAQALEIEAVDEIAERTHLRGVNQLLEWLLAELSVRERRVLNMRFGLMGGPEQTLEEIGRVLGVTRERVRQIQNEALKKIRGRAQQVPVVRLGDSWG